MRSVKIREEGGENGEDCLKMREEGGENGEECEKMLDVME